MITGRTDRRTDRVRRNMRPPPREEGRIITRKEVKYPGIVGRHMFEPIAVETLGVFNASAIHLLNDLGRRISSISGDTRETSHLYQRLSVLLQRFNAVLLHDSLPVPDCTD